MNGNSKIQNNVTSHVLHIWAFALYFLRFREGFRKSKGDFESVTDFSKCSDLHGYVNALGRKNRPCRPLHKETRRRITDRYLTGEGPKAISTAARATPGAVYCIIRHHETFSTCEAFSQGDEVILLNFQTTLHVESIELFKLAKPRIYGWENRERLLSSRLCNRRSTGHQSVI